MKTRHLPILVVTLLCLIGRAVVAFEGPNCHLEPTVAPTAGHAMHDHDGHPPAARHCASADHACCHGVGVPAQGLTTTAPREGATYLAFRMPDVRVPSPPVLLRPPISV